MPEPLLTTAEAAAYMRLSPHTLENWRWRGTGPAYVRCGRAVRYRRAALEGWLERGTQAPLEVARQVAPGRTLIALPRRHRRPGR